MSKERNWRVDTDSQDYAEVYLHVTRDDDGTEIRFEVISTPATCSAVLHMRARQEPK